MTTTPYQEWLLCTSQISMLYVRAEWRCQENAAPCGSSYWVTTVLSRFGVAIWAPAAACRVCTAQQCDAAQRATAHWWTSMGTCKGSKARGTLRTRQHIKEMAAAYQDGGNASRGTPLSLKEHLSIERRPLLILDPSHTSPMPLHLVFGITVWLLRLGIEAVTGWRARAFTLRTWRECCGTGSGSNLSLTSGGPSRADNASALGAGFPWCARYWTAACPSG